MFKSITKLLENLWIIALIVFLFILPKLVDYMYSSYVYGFLDMKHIEASDFLSYLGTIISGLFTLIAVLVAIKQFRTEKTPIIIPQCKEFYMTDNSIGFMFYDKDDFDRDFYIEHLNMTMNNVSENTALDYSLVFNYAEGKWFKSICKSINGNSSDPYTTYFSSTSYLNQGVLSSKSTSEVYIPSTLLQIIKGLCYRTTKNGTLKVRTNAYRNFVFKQHKIAELKVITRDINDRENTTVFNIKMQISPILKQKDIFVIKLIFVIKDK